MPSGSFETLWKHNLAQAWPAKGKVGKLEQLRQQAWRGTWQKRVRQEWPKAAGTEMLHTCGDPGRRPA